MAGPTSRFPLVRETRATTVHGGVCVFMCARAIIIWAYHQFAKCTPGGGSPALDDLIARTRRKRPDIDLINYYYYYIICTHLYIYIYIYLFTRAESFLMVSRVYTHRARTRL